MTRCNFTSLAEIKDDPIARIMMAYSRDPAEDKIDVSVGVYKDEKGNASYVFPSVQTAKEILAQDDPGHCYTNMAGIPAFTAGAQRTIFGTNHDNVVSVQGISGSGALHLALLLLRMMLYKDFYVGTPSWLNYEGMIEHVGGNHVPYNYYNAKDHSVDFESVVKALETAPLGSVFILQAICHNPTGCDLSPEQWSIIFDLLEKNKHFALFDIAYQGFASGDIDTDAYAIREAYRRGLEFIVAQSYSKNMGLYSERVGCTHVCTQDKSAVVAIKSQLVSIVRHEFSFPPAFGSRIATILQDDDEIRQVWFEDVKNVCKRLHRVRQQVATKLKELGTPGSWDHVQHSSGLFWLSGLSELQMSKLMDEHNVYGTLNGRISVAGLNDGNVDKFCRAVDQVVRKYPN